MNRITFAFFNTICVASFFLAAVSCAPHKSETPNGTGTLIVDADISKGTRFIVYCNDVWSAPERQPVVAGQRTKYSFPLPSSLRSLRLDPSESADSHVVIHSVTLDMEGQPKKALPLTDLPKFLTYHCSVAMHDNAAEINASGPEMYFMSTVNPASYPVASGS